MHAIADQLMNTRWPEFVAVISGLISVLYARRENVLVFPAGLLSTIIYTWISFEAHLLGEASVNFYYTIMSLYGWYWWQKRGRAGKPALQITFSTRKEWGMHLAFATLGYLIIYVLLNYARQNFYPGAVPWADAFASVAAYTGMYLMARKKVESWFWWMATNLASIPLYYQKGFAFTSLQFLVLFVLALSGWQAWHRKALACRKADNPNPLAGSVPNS